MGLNKDEISDKLQQLPIRQPEAVSASMYRQVPQKKIPQRDYPPFFRTYHYHSTMFQDGRTRWNRFMEWPVLKNLFNTEREEAEPPHCDLGLVTVMPRSAIAGLQVRQPF